MSVSSLLNPVLNDRLTVFENWSSELLEIPVKISRVEVAWRIYEPEITFENVTVLDKQTHKPKFAIQQIKINLNILRSLASWKPIAQNIKVSGIHLTIQQPKEGHFHIKELNVMAVIDKTTGAPSNVKDVLAWVFTQPNLALENIDISYRPHEGPEQSLTLNELMLKNVADQHLLIGDAVLNQDVPTQVSIRLDWTGNPMDLEHVSAKAYLYLKAISLPQWVSKFSWRNLQIKEGLGSAKIWLTWNKNQFQQIQSQFQFYDLILKSSETHKSQEIPRLSGHVGWKREGDKEIFAGSDILIDLSNHLWPMTGFKVTAMSTADGAYQVEKLHISYLDLDDSKKIALASGLLPEHVHKIMTAFDPKGEIRNLYAELPKKPLSDFAQSDFEKMQLGVQFAGISFNAWQTYPGIFHATGQFDWNGKQATLNLDSQKTGILYSRLFANPLSFEALTGLLRLQKTSDGSWLLNGKNIQAVNQDLKAHAELSMTVPVNESPYINFAADFNVMKAANISHYTPQNILDEDLREWLRSAFLSGQIDSGKAVLQGHLNEFPFINGKGTFLVSGIVKDMNLHYAPHWPIVKNINGVLTFSGASMLAEVNSGQILDIPLSLVRGEIPYIGKHEPQILNIQGYIQSDAAQGLNFIHQSPLQKKIGKDIEGMELNGGLQLKLKLSIPLKQPADTKVEGDATLEDAKLNLPQWDLALDGINGSFQFSESDLNSSNLKGQMWNEPISVSFATQHEKDKSSYLKAKIESKITIANLEKWLKMSLSNYAQGATDYQAELNLASHDKQQSSQILMKTNLKGVAINLPEPYGKKAEESRDFKVKMTINKNEPIKMKLNYDKLLSAAASFQSTQQAMKFVSGELRLGKGEARIPSQPGLVVAAHFDTLDWDTLQPYFDMADSHNKPTASATTSSSKSQFDMGVFRSINLDANQVNLFGQRLNTARFQVSKTNNNWLININSEQVVGQVTTPANFSQVRGRFERFYITSSSSKRSVMDPKSLPSLSIVANDVRYGDKRLGNLVLDTSPIPTGLQFRQLALNSQLGSLNATGTWKMLNDQYKTRLQGQLSTEHLSLMLKQLGLDASSLIAEKGNAKFDLNWANAPYNPTIASMSGNLSINLGHGRVVNLSESTEVKMGLGRMVSLFSLQSIPRRLSFDFSDLFQNGYSFDSMTGSFRLQSGSAYTQDTQFDGPVARIDIAGRIGLQAKDYNLKLGVTTYVTSTLIPAAISVINPLAGVATWLASAVVNKATSKLATYQYRIVGSWDNPSWQQLGSSSAS